MASTKAAKMLRRTLVGGSLAAALALILWWTSHTGDGAPVLWAAAVALVAAIFETSRMGSLARRTLLPVLLVAAAGALALAQRALAGDALARDLAARLPAFDASLLGVWRADLATLYAWTGGLALASAATLHALGRALPRSGPAARGILYVGFCAVILFVTNDPAEVSARLGPAFAVLAVLVACSLPLVAIDRAWRGIAIATGLALWLVPPLPALWQVWARFGIGGLVSLLVLSKVGDTAGYYVGNAVGRTHPFPRISPGKTTAGCVASLAAATAVGGALSAAGVLPAGSHGFADGLVAGALVNVAAQAGDLFESWVKRRTGVKDSSTVFGPSGGVLDQVDSLLFSVPVALIAWPVILG